MAKVKISKVEPNEKELKAEKLLEKDISKVKTIEKGAKVKAKATKAKAATTKAKTTTTRKTTTKKAKEEEIEK